MEQQLPVAVVCRVLGAPRSTVYARRQPQVPAHPGPATSISDHDLVQLIRLVLRASPFAGEGYRKIRARLRREHGIRVSGKRVLRLLRREGLLAPQRPGRRPGHRSVQRRPGHVAQRPLGHRVVEPAIGGRPRPGGRPDDLEPGGLQRRHQRPGRTGVVDHHGAWLPPLVQLDQTPDHPADAGPVDDLGVAQPIGAQPGDGDGGVGPLGGHVGREGHRVDRGRVGIGQGPPVGLGDDQPVGRDLARPPIQVRPAEVGQSSRSNSAAMRASVTV
jgi:hypothetical protein